jgi:hypothetical protein
MCRPTRRWRGCWSRRPRDRGRADRRARDQARGAR